MKKLFSLIIFCIMSMNFVQGFALDNNDYASVYFGSYPKTQISSTDGLTLDIDYVKKDNKYYKVEPIEWEVIEEDDDSLLLLSKDNIDVKPYSDSRDPSPTSWGNCALRKWLNSEDFSSNSSEFKDNRDGFLNKAFNDEEKSKIISSNVAYVEGYSGPFSKLIKETKEIYNQKVFLMSCDEIEGLSKNDSSIIISQNTDFVNSYRKSCGSDIYSYWLRDSLSENNMLDSFETGFTVNINGKMNNKWVERNSCIRPAIKVDKSTILK